MTDHTRHPLDAEERALRAQLPRLHGRGEPGPLLDASILSAARAAATKAPPRTRRRSWIMPLSVAATVTVAVGLAWRLQPPDAAPAFEQAASEYAASEQAASEQAAVEYVRPDVASSVAAEPAAAPQAADAAARISRIEAAPAAPELVAPASAPVQRKARTHAVLPSEQELVTQAAPMSAPAAPPPPAPPPPAPSVPRIATDSVASEAAMVADAPAPLSAPKPVASAAPPTSQIAARASAQQQAQAIAAEKDAAARIARSKQAASQAARAAAADVQAFEMADDEAPPVSMDMPAAREAWLRRIIELLDQGETQNARESLAEFRRRYPNATLPPRLDALEKAKPAAETD